MINIDAILYGVAFAPIERGFLRITGPDATRWLNGMVTNNIKDLAPGCGNYNFLLNAQGRILGDCTIYREPGDGPATFLLETENSQLETLQNTLDKFIIMDDVELAKGLQIMGQPAVGLTLLGSDALDVLSQVLGEINDADEPAQLPVPDAGTMSFAQMPYRKNSVLPILRRPSQGVVVVLRNPDLSSPRLELWFQEQKDMDFVVREMTDLSVSKLSAETLEAFRIYSGTPKYGIDIRNTDTARDLPQETALNGGQSRALNFNKGCYLGQEIVERIHSRGQVHRTFNRFNLTGELPPELPVSLEANGKPAGELTSAARIHTAEHGERIYALGYARREALETRAIFTYPGGTAVPLIPNP